MTKENAGNLLQELASDIEMYVMPHALADRLADRINAIADALFADRDEEERLAAAEADAADRAHERILGS